MAHTLFLRDDDVYEYTPGFIELFEFLKARGIPVIYGVVPALLQKRLALFLNRQKFIGKAAFDLIQHGFAHKNYAAEGASKYEFGPGRSYSQQERDMACGYRKMLRYFGKNFTPAFVPPFHGYDHNTLAAAEKLNIRLFSAGAAITPSKKFLDMPAYVSLNDYDRTGAPLALQADIMIKMTLRQMERGRITGMVFHHSAITGRGYFKEMKFFLLFLDKLRKERKLRIILFSEILRSGKRI